MSPRRHRVDNKRPDDENDQEEPEPYAQVTHNVRREPATVLSLVPHPVGPQHLFRVQRQQRREEEGDGEASHAGEVRDDAEGRHEKGRGEGRQHGHESEQGLLAAVGLGAQGVDVRAVVPAHEGVAQGDGVEGEGGGDVEGGQKHYEAAGVC